MNSATHTVTLRRNRSEIRFLMTKGEAMVDRCVGITKRQVTAQKALNEMRRLQAKGYVVT